MRRSVSLLRPPKNSKVKRFFTTAWSPPRDSAISHYIIREAVDTPADGLYDRVARMPQYEGVLLDSQEAMLRAAPPRYRLRPAGGGR